MSRSLIPKLNFISNNAVLSMLHQYHSTLCLTMTQSDQRTLKVLHVCLSCIEFVHIEIFTLGSICFWLACQFTGWLLLRLR